MRVFDLLLRGGECELAKPERLASDTTEPNTEAAQVCPSVQAPSLASVPRAMRAPLHNQAEALRALALAPQPMLKSLRTVRGA